MAAKWMIALALGACSCGDDGSGTGTSTGGGGPGGATVGGDGVGGLGAGGAGSAGGTGAGGTIEASWSVEQWPTCAVERGLPASAAAPSIEWVGCNDPSATTGCDHILDKWSSAERGPIKYATPNFAGPAGQELTGFYGLWPDDAARTLVSVHGADGIATAAFRVGQGCAITQPVVDTAGFWLGTQNFDNGSAYMREEFSRPGQPTVLPFTFTTQGRDGTPELFFMELGGSGVSVYDHVTGQVSSFTPPQSVSATYGSPGSENLAVRNFVTDSLGEGWVWDRPTGDFVPVVQIPGKSVISFHESDGQLVWFQADEADPAGPGELWRAPTTKVAANLAPVLVGALPPWGGGDRVGGGYYAQIINQTLQVRIVRLSDGATATITVPPTDALIRDIAHLTEQTIVLHTQVDIRRWAIPDLFN